MSSEGLADSCNKNQRDILIYQIYFGLEIYMFRTVDVYGSVHLSTNHIEITNKMQPCTRIYYYIFINPLNAELNPICHLLALLGAHHIFHVRRIRVNCSTCFERHTAHHQELKTAIAASVFTYLCG